MKILINKGICFLLSAILLTIAADSAEAQTEKEIAQIRAAVAAINKNAAKYSKTTKTVEDIALEGTEATFYHSDGNLKKITAKMYGETYNASGEFYYADDKLIFAFYKRNQYSEQLGADRPPKFVRTEEQRFYFADGDLIRLLVGKKELKSADKRFHELKNGIADTSNRLKNSD